MILYGLKLEYLQMVLSIISLDSFSKTGRNYNGRVVHQALELSKDLNMSAIGVFHDGGSC